jgi:hypothetical protein
MLPPQLVADGKMMVVRITNTMLLLIHHPDGVELHTADLATE